MSFGEAGRRLARGPRKGEPSSRSMRYGLRAQPAHLVRGSSRRIMTMRFRPAHIRLIHRRVCRRAVRRPASSNTRAGRPLPRDRPALSIRQPQRGLTESLHIRTRDAAKAAKRVLPCRSGWRRPHRSRPRRCRAATCRDWRTPAYSWCCRSLHGTAGAVVP